MRTSRVSACTFLGTCFLSFAAGGPSAVCAQSTGTAGRAAPAAAPTQAETAIRKSAQEFVDAFNKGDAKAVAAMWTPDGDYFDETGERTSGREAIEKKYAAFFAGHPGAKLEITIDAVRQIGPDTALEDGHSTLAVTPKATAQSKYTVVHVKRDGAWLMSSVREFPMGSTHESNPLEDLAWMVGTWHAEHLGAEVEVDCRWLANKSFVEVTYSKKEGKELTPTATQIIGVNPRTGQLSSWMFSGDGGVATGDWMPRDAGWIIDTAGVTTAGVPTRAVNMLFKVNDALVWKSLNRSVAGTPIADTDEVVLKRK